MSPLVAGLMMTSPFLVLWIFYRLFVYPNRDESEDNPGDIDL